MLLPLKRYTYTFLLINLLEGQRLHGFAETTLNSQIQSKTVISNSVGKVPTKVMLREGGELGETKFQDVSGWQPGCGLPASKYKPEETNERIIGVSGGKCTHQHAFPWMARLVG